MRISPHMCLKKAEESVCTFTVTTEYYSGESCQLRRRTLGEVPHGLEGRGFDRLPTRENLWDTSCPGIFFENILGGIGIPVEFTPAFTGMPAFVQGFCLHRTAIGANLTRIFGVHESNHAPGAFCLGAQHFREHTPTCVSYTLV